MSDMVTAIRRAKDTGDFSELVAAVPYWRFLGISAELSAGEMLGKLSFSDPLIGNPVLPALHGGTIGALLESTAVFELFWQAETVVLPKTINITVAYLRSGRPQDTWAKAVITKHGRRVASVRVEAWQDDRARPIASASANFLVTPMEC